MTRTSLVTCLACFLAFVTQARGDLTSALQARRVLSKLRDKHFENWQKEDNAQEMKQMDEFALARFARQAKHDDGGAAS